MKKIDDVLSESSNFNDEMQIKRMDITPELAEKMLDTMGDNRIYKPTVGSKYRRDMESNRWYLSPNPISFDKDGHLMDGQHRLRAVIDSGKSEPFLIALSVDRETPIDIQKQRTTSDNLIYSGRLSKEDGSQKNVSLVNALLKIRASGTVFNSFSDFDKEHILEKYRQEIGIAISVSYAGAHHPILKKAAVQASFVAAIVSGADLSKMYDFAETANSGLPKGDNPNPALIASRMLTKLKLNRRQTMSVIEQALADCLNGKPRKINYDPDSDKGLPFTDKLSLEEIMK